MLVERQAAVTQPHIRNDEAEGNLQVAFEAEFMDKSPAF